MVPKNNIDYVEFYSESLKNNSCFFKDQKCFIESQLKNSRVLFGNIFGKGKQFKENARKYLRTVGIIK